MSVSVCARESVSECALLGRNKEVTGLHEGDDEGEKRFGVRMSASASVSVGECECE